MGSTAQDPAKVAVLRTKPSSPTIPTMLPAGTSSTGKTEGPWDRKTGLQQERVYIHINFEKKITTDQSKQFFLPN